MPDTSLSVIVQWLVAAVMSDLIRRVLGLAAGQTLDVTVGCVAWPGLVLSPGGARGRSA